MGDKPIMGRVAFSSYTPNEQERQALERAMVKSMMEKPDDRDATIADLQARLADCERVGEQHRIYGLEMDSAWRAKQEQNDELRAEVARLNSAIAKMADAAMHASKNLDVKDAELAETRRLLDVQLAAGDKLTAEVQRVQQKCFNLEVDNRQMLRDIEIYAAAKKSAEAELAALREAAINYLNAVGSRDEDGSTRLSDADFLADAYEALRDALGR